ncbi:MAG: TonB-dependent receptor plug domain-containing protein [Gluconobacter oxydans]
MPAALAETSVTHTKRPKAHIVRKTPLPVAPKKRTAVQAGRDESLQVQGRHLFAFGQAQRQPDSNTRISAQTLLERRVVSVTDLQNLAPNLTVQSLKGTQSINYHLRGVGLDDYYENNVSSVMVYLDGVAYPFSSMTDGMMFDIANVDIAPGPVGFTHGMSDTGGEVSLQSNDPTPDWHGNITEDIASYARSRTSGFISGPLARNLSFRVAAQTTQGGSWQYNPLSGAHLGDQNQTALRAKLKWTPDDKTVVALGGH